MEPMLRVRWQSGSMGLGVSMSGILTLGVCPSGLRVGIMRVFGPFCRDFFVLWEDIRITRRTVLFWPVAKLQFGSPRRNCNSFCSAFWTRRTVGTEKQGRG
jgi:hypothetical protein